MNEKKETIAILEKVINDFSTDNLVRLFRNKTTKFRMMELPAPENSFFTNGLLLGEFECGDSTICIYTFKAHQPLTERSGKKTQYDLAKKILKQEIRYAGGFFIFYDEQGNFRFSLVYDIPLSSGRREWSNFKRYTYYVSKEQTNKTFIQQMAEADFSSLDSIIEAFSVEKVTEEFFNAYQYALNNIIIKSLDKYVEVEEEKKHSFSQQLLSRILFIYFLQKKGWLKWKDYVQDKNYLRNLWQTYKITTNNKDTFYSVWLKSLFFGAFNKKSQYIETQLPEDIRESYNLMPFLNGGLFHANELDMLNFNLPDTIFEWLFEPDPTEKEKQKGFLEIFNFTIDEASPNDEEVAVDPEMLGKVYESLISSEERGEGGIFYTHRIEIDFMCRLSLVEYVHQKTSFPKDEIIDLIFNPESILHFPDPLKLGTIKANLDKIKIVDPAVGSASFLVGMMNILVEIHTLINQRLSQKEENLFALKQKIILENLYGVDVKDWAVMVGELRLWLSLIIETDEKYMDIYTKPLLPNLSFKIRQGDSLVEEIAGINISLRGEAFTSLSNSIKNKILNLIDRKTTFFSSQRSADLKETKEIELFEQDIFKDIIKSKIDELEKKINNKHQRISFLQKQKKEDLFGDDISTYNEIKNIQKEIADYQKELFNYQNVFSNIGSKTEKDYFLWEIDFAEVFALKGGFDLVIGNPPYIRQELIAPPTEHEKNYSKNEWLEIKKQYKEKLATAVKTSWPQIKKINKKSDLYIYFYYQGLSLLNKGGLLCFINLNSWLDVGYGTGLQEFLLKYMKPICIIDNIAKRSFKQADVNTVIVLIQRPDEKPQDYQMKFIAFKKPFDEVINPTTIKKISLTDKLIFDNEDFRLFPKTKMELLKEGVEIPTDREDLGFNYPIDKLPYVGNKWGGKYLRAPEIYFKILEKGKDKLVRLGDIAEVRFGIKTGANDFFYLKPVGMTVKQVVETAETNPNALIKVQNGAGWIGEIEATFLKPVITNYENVDFIKIEPDQLIFLYPEVPYKETNYVANFYIKWGENYKTKGGQKQEAGIPLPKIQSLKGRKYWYSFKPSEELLAKIFWQKRTGERFCVFYTEKFSYADQKLYPFINIHKKTNELIFILNSTIQRLFFEIEGISYTGAYTLIEISVKDLERLPFINLNNLEIYENKIEGILSKKRFDSIFSELGFDKNKPIREQEPNPLPDRKALDDIVFDAIGLTEEERKEVYWAVAELVKSRLDKAQSV
jgi:hypothetical protein